MKKSLLLLSLLCLLSMTAYNQTVNYDDVAVIINENSPESIRIGRYFQEKRQIPSQNIISIKCSTAEKIDSAEFQELRLQIEDYLLTSKLTEKINYLVTTKGVPLTIQYNDCQDGWPRCATVDNELTLILSPYQSAIGQAGFLENPFYHSDEPFKRSNFRTYLVSRLTAYTTQDVLTLIDRSGPDLSVQAETAKFILDLTNMSQDHPLFDFYASNFEQTANMLIAKNWNVTYDPDMPMVTEQENLLGYCNVNEANGVHHTFNTWLNGSLADLPYAYSARTFTENLVATDYPLQVADLIAEGATGGHGFMSEPMVGNLLNGDLLFDGYTNSELSYNLAESYYRSMPALSWHSVVVGDPKTSLFIEQGLNAVDSPLTKIDWMVYPNPSVGDFTIRLPKDQYASSQVAIYNMLGQCILKRVVTSDILSIELDDNQKGIFKLRVERAGYLPTERLLIIR